MTLSRILFLMFHLVIHLHACIPSGVKTCACSSCPCGSANSYQLILQPIHTSSAMFQSPSSNYENSYPRSTYHLHSSNFDYQQQTDAQPDHYSVISPASQHLTNSQFSSSNAGSSSSVYVYPTAEQLSPKPQPQPTFQAIDSDSYPRDAFPTAPPTTLSPYISLLPSLLSDPLPSQAISPPVPKNPFLSLLSTELPPSPSFQVLSSLNEEQEEENTVEAAILNEYVSELYDNQDPSNKANVDSSVLDEKINPSLGYLTESSTKSAQTELSEIFKELSETPKSNSVLTDTITEADLPSETIQSQPPSISPLSKTHGKTTFVSQIQVPSSVQTKEVDSYLSVLKPNESEMETPLTYFNQQCSGEKIGKTVGETYKSIMRKCHLLGCNAVNLGSSDDGLLEAIFLRRVENRMNFVGMKCISMDPVRLARKI